jgi:hypothetical protein
MEWQPIESAPKDGTAILAYIPFAWANEEPAALQDVVEWHGPAGSNGFWFSRTAPNYHQACDKRCQPTHWMPLPAPPNA